MTVKKQKDLNLEYTKNFDEIYWSYNLPLQLWAIQENSDGKDIDESEQSSIKEWGCLNYMPRKEAVSDLGEYIGQDEIGPVCRNTIKILQNLIEKFKELESGKINHIYYPVD